MFLASFFFAFVDSFIAPSQHHFFSFPSSSIIPFYLFYFLVLGVLVLELLVGGSIGILGSISDLALHLCFVALITGWPVVAVGMVVAVA